MKRKKSDNGFCKRVRHLGGGAGTLQSIRNSLQRGDYPAALALIDRAVAGTSDVGEQTGFLALAADCLFRQGRFAEAAEAYGNIYSRVQDQPASWFRPALGQILSLLKNVQVYDAQVKALAAVETATIFYQHYLSLIAGAPVLATASGLATIPPEPPHPAKVAARLGKIFFSEGEVSTAKSLYDQAVQMEPGSVKALLGLAEVAIRGKDALTAIDIVLKALAQSHYHADSLAGWPILLAAGHMAGIDVLQNGLLNNLSQSPATVRARATLLIVKTLRSQGDARWREIGANWLAAYGAVDSSVAAELRKLDQARAQRAKTGWAERRQLAQAVQQTPGISPMEWLASIKQLSSADLSQGRIPNIDDLVQQGAVVYGHALRPLFRHSLGLVCQKSGRADLALRLFQNNVSDSSASKEQAGKSLWALARLLSASGDHVAAAQNYWTYSQDPAAPQRFAIYALVQWITELTAAGQPHLMTQCRPKIETVLPQITDYELLLDLARKVFNIRTPDASWHDFSLHIFQRGRQAALQSFNAAATPAVAAGILFRLYRRACNDFHDAETVLSSWKQLPEIKKQWLWSEAQEYWYCLEFVFRSYRDAGRLVEAEQFITPLLKDPATPPCGTAILGSSYAVLKCNQKDFLGMYAVYGQMVKTAPAHEWTSSAYYWLALKAWNAGEATEVTAYANKMLQVLGSDSGLYWKKDYAAAAWLLKSGLLARQVPSQAGLATDVLQKQLQSLQSNLALLVN